MLNKIKHYALVLLLTVLTIGTAHSSNELSRATDTQKATLQQAFDYGLNSKLQYSDYDHLGYILAGIAWVESRAGANTGANKPGHKSFGVFQNYTVTVKTRMEQSPEYPDKVSNEFIKHALESDFNTSAKFAMIELSFWDKSRKGNMFNTLASYNAGYKIDKGYNYANRVLKQAKHFKDIDYFGHESKNLNKESLCLQILQSQEQSISSLASRQKLKSACTALTQSDYSSNVVKAIQAFMSTQTKPN